MDDTWPSKLNLESILQPSNLIESDIGILVPKLQRKLLKLKVDLKSLSPKIMSSVFSLFSFRKCASAQSLTDCMQLGTTDSRVDNDENAGKYLRPRLSSAYPLHLKPADSKAISMLEL